MDSRHRVAEGVWLGGALKAQNVDELKKDGITHILQLLWMAKRSDFPKGFDYMTVDVMDREDADLITSFPACISYIDAAIASGGAVLVHCSLGVSRSTTVVAAWMMAKQRQSRDQVLKTLDKLRPVGVRPNPGFMAQLEMWQNLGYSLEGKSSAHEEFRKRLDRTGHYVDPNFLPAEDESFSFMDD